MTPSAHQQTVTASESERQSLEQLEAMLQQSASMQTPRLVGPTGEEIALPESVLTALRQLVHHLAQNEAIAIAPVSQMLTTQEAADILNVSRPYLVKLLDDGALPSIKVGTHRRVRFGDIMAYKRQRDAERERALDHLAALNQEMGLYND